MPIVPLKLIQMTFDEELKDRIGYNPETGVLTWVKPRARRTAAGSVAGLEKGGYLAFEFRDKFCLAHRVAWFLQNGSWPPNEIDHINGDGMDNRIANLRLATMPQNRMNRGKYANNSTGFKGVCFHKGTGKFSAQIQANKVRVHIGLFDTAEEASEAYLEASTKYHGVFARAA